MENRKLNYLEKFTIVFTFYDILLIIKNNKYHLQILFSIKIQFFSHRDELFKTREKTRIRGKKRRRFEIISGGCRNCSGGW